LAGAMEAMAAELAGAAHVVRRSRLRLAATRGDDVQLTSVIEAVLAAPMWEGIGGELEALCVGAASDTSGSHDVAAHLPVIDALISGSRPAMRRVALGVLQRLAPAQQWGAPWRERLVRLRRDADPGVRMLACGVFLYAE
jgi:hypothetical protein